MVALRSESKESRENIELPGDDSISSTSDSSKGKAKRTPSRGRQSAREERARPAQKVRLRLSATFDLPLRELYSAYNYHVNIVKQSHPRPKPRPKKVPVVSCVGSLR